MSLVDKLLDPIPFNCLIMYRSTELALQVTEKTSNSLFVSQEICSTFPLVSSDREPKASFQFFLPHIIWYQLMVDGLRKQVREHTWLKYLPPLM